MLDFISKVCYYVTGTSVSVGCPWIVQLTGVILMSYKKTSLFRRLLTREQWVTVTKTKARV